VAAFEPGVVVEADAGELGDLLAAQAGHAALPVAGDAGLLGGDVAATGGEELPHLVLRAHDRHARSRVVLAGRPCKALPLLLHRTFRDGASSVAHSTTSILTPEPSSRFSSSSVAV